MATPEQIQSLLDGPSLAPPPGVLPNFADPANFRTLFIITVVLCLTFSISALSMRMYTKIIILHKGEWADYTAVLGWLMTVTYCGLTGKLIYLGAGVHQWNIQLKNASQALFYMNILSIMYGITVSIVKLSIVLQYLSIFVPIRKWNVMFLGCHMVIWSHVVFYAAATFFEIFLCTPRDKFWNPLMTGGHCYNAIAINIAAGAFNAASDFVILLLPQGIIWKLQMRWERKVGISAIFLAGFFACITSVMRLYYAVRIRQTGDVTYESGPMGLWTLAEFAITIVCGCMPVLPKFFQTVGPKVLESGSSVRAMLKVSKFSGTSANRSAMGELGGSSRDLYGSQHQLHARYDSIKEHELDRVPEKSSKSSSPGRPLPSLPAEAIMSQTALDAKQEGNRILRTVHIETRRQIEEPDVERQQRRDW